MTHWFQHSWKRSKELVFLKSKSRGVLGFLYEYQKELFRLREVEQKIQYTCYWCLIVSGEYDEKIDC